VRDKFSDYRVKEQEADLAEEDPGGKSSGEGLFEEGRILVMDDEAIMRDLFRDMLRLLGYEAEVVNDGQEAVELFEKAKRQGRPFVKAILDLTVPCGMGGEETIKELLKIDPTVKAIVSSGYPNDPVIKNYEQYGFRAALSKPYLMRELQETLFRLDSP
jgi:two-component system, cell cycle sensor histidine kinase and response regulator CckA